MSIIATAVRHLMAAGVTGEALVAAIAEMEAAQPKDAAAERRRAWDRERKRKAKEAGNSTGIPPESAENAEPGFSLPPNENNSNPPTHIPEKQTPRARKGTRLPAEWIPAELDAGTQRDVSAWPEGSVERELAKFRDWAAAATGSNAVKSDWNAAWRNWLRKAQDEGRYGNASNRNGAGSGNVRPFAKPKDGAIAALDRRLGLDGSPGANPSYDTVGGEADRGRAATGARRLFS